MMKKYIMGLTALFASSAAFANNCATTVESNDAMQFNTSEVSIPASCDEFTVTLKHTGSLPKQSMGHNWVVTKKADAQAVASDGISAGLENDYLKPNDARVIGATKVIGGGQETSTTFSVAELDKDGEYMFFCSFPGHISLMKGTVTFAN
jgi:azurin